MKFNDLGLRPELLRAVAEAGWDQPTPIQERAIPVALEGRDVLGCAQTGTGKTAGYLLPVLERLSARVTHPVRSRGPRALILAPTRELAAQIEAAARALGRFAGVSAAAIFGGVGMNPQTAALRRGVDVLIATPGRLLDHLGRRHVDFAALEVLVVDEADRMLDMGFLPDVKRILAALPARRQNLLFSATMPAEVEDLIARTLRQPVRIEVTPRATVVGTIHHVLHRVAGDRKRELLAHLLGRGDLGSVLVFTRTKARTDRVAKFLKTAGTRVLAIHGDKGQGARTRALGDFRSGAIDVLVATDIAARGLDVEGIGHVINFDVPTVAEDYVHRIGRTGRAERTGRAITFAAPEDMAQVRAIERLIGEPIEEVGVAGFAPVHADRSAPPPAPRPGHPLPAHRAVRAAAPGPSPGASAGRREGPAPVGRPSAGSLPAAFWRPASRRVERSRRRRRG